MAEYLSLKKSNCKNCYKCIRHCPVKSIRFSGNQAHIIPDECVLCGQCFVVCPQNAKQIVDDTEKAQVLISSGEKVIASLAPSFIANFDGVGIAQMEKALKQLGFYAAEETAMGATQVKRGYEEMLKEHRKSVVISSCCHTVNLLIQKHFPEALPYLADVVTPMNAHGQDIKRRYPGAKVVFIGPCLSKKDEADRYPGAVDCVLTFEECSRWFKSKGITLERAADRNPESRARLFPTTGGILKTMDLDVAPDYTYIAIDGMDNCIAALRDVIDGKLKDCFIEMSACTGSCINGPVMEKYHASPLQNYQQVTRYAGKQDFDVTAAPEDDMRRHHLYIGNNAPMPGRSEIESILRQMGKTRPEDELNCGSCGYNTCREKAIAVYQGKADLSMCLPFLKDRAENFSDTIIGNTPNGIIVLNDNLEVQQINNAACRIMNLRSPSEVLGEQVICIHDPKPFLDVLNTGRAIRNNLVYLAEYKKYVEETILYDREYRVLMCIMRDVTLDQQDRDRKEQMARATAETADKVVEKQMRVVQEIASLLGETAAETKIALTKLKESLSDE